MQPTLTNLKPSETKKLNQNEPISTDQKKFWIKISKNKDESKVCFSMPGKAKKSLSKIKFSRGF